MTKFWQQVAASLLTAALVANVALLFRFNERLARLETKFDIQFAQSQNPKLANK